MKKIPLRNKTHEINLNRISLGYYKSEEEAALVRNEGTKKHFKDYGKLNSV